MGFAKGTEVPVERTQREIEVVLERYGASQFFRGWKGDDAHLGFRIKERIVRFDLPMPPKTAREFQFDRQGRQRSKEQAERFWKAEERRRWRALALVIKAKLEAVETGISTLEREFLANILLPDGALVGEAIRPALQAAYETGEMPRLLASGQG